MQVTCVFLLPLTGRSVSFVVAEGLLARGVVRFFSWATANALLCKLSIMEQDEDADLWRHAFTKDFTEEMREAAKCSWHSADAADTAEDDDPDVNQAEQCKVSVTTKHYVRTQRARCSDNHTITLPNRRHFK